MGKTQFVLQSTTSPTTDTSSPPDTLTPDEIKALLEEIAWRKARPFQFGPSSRLPQWVEDLVVVMLNTGLRVNAAIHMEFKWVESQGINLPKKFSKGKKPYTAIANSKVRSIIQRRRQEVTGDRVFPEVKGAAWMWSRLNYLVKSLVRKKKWTRDPGHYNHIMKHIFVLPRLSARVFLWSWRPN